ncbi:hypothetical protein [Streptomyces sp. NPDC059063]|uniref:hypothetical protein n=1 Tax=unclassified Streptomyces TaxID=2593676 RepID=UPI0036A76CEC
MHRTRSVATSAVAVLALALTGCGGDDKNDHASGTADVRESASPTPSPTKKPRAAKTPSPASGSPTPTRTAPRTGAPAPPRTSAPAVPPKRTTKPTTPTKPTKPAAGPQSVQGTWYHVARGSGGRLIVLTVNGTSMNMRSGGKSCPGTITAAMTITATCMGEVGRGRATLSGGQLSFVWPGDGGTDYFRRTQPPA